ncbi:MAG: GNAT family N-acetyltransferase [Actinomycetota bacterium]|nr:GNAT family N-acetyltransferase [Actinomycetota bacterium]
MPIVTERLALEPLRVDHADEMAIALSDAHLYTYTGGEPPSAEQLATRYARQIRGRAPDGEQGWCNWVIRQRSGDAVGYVQATIEADSGLWVAEIAWVLAVGAQGRGLATEAVRAMVAWLRERGVDQLVAHVHPQHVASAAVAERAGLRATAVLIDGEVRWHG